MKLFLMLDEFINDVNLMRRLLACVVFDGNLLDEMRIGYMM